MSQATEKIQSTLSSAKEHYRKFVAVAEVAGLLMVGAACGATTPSKKNETIAGTGPVPTATATGSQHTQEAPAPAVPVNESNQAPASETTPSSSNNATVAEIQQSQFTDTSLSTKPESAEQGAEERTVPDSKLVGHSWTAEDFNAAFESDVLGVFKRNPDGTLTRLDPKEHLDAGVQLWIGAPGTSKYGQTLTGYPVQ